MVVLITLAEKIDRAVLRLLLVDFSSQKIYSSAPLICRMLFQSEAAKESLCCDATVQSKSIINLSYSIAAVSKN